MVNSKKVFLIRNVLPEDYGGGESYQLTLAKELKNNGFCPVIVSSSEKLLDNSRTSGYEYIKAPHLKNQNWSSWRNFFLPLYYLWQFRLKLWYKKQFKKYQPVAVDIQSRDDWIAATKAAKKQGIKIFWTDHIDFRTWVLQNVNQRFKNTIGKKILKLASLPEKIIMISDYERRAFEKTVAPRKFDNLITIKNGTADELKKYNKPAQPKTFCYVGRIVEYKGIKELIEAFKLVKDKDATLKIYGDSPELKSYKELAKDDKRIVFCGYTKAPLEAISDAAIFVLPSYYEGLSMSLLDACMLQKTLVATDVDGNPEIVVDDETGLLVPPRNIKALAAAMEKLIKDPKLAARLAKNARKKYEAEFNFEKTIKEKLIPLI